MALGGDGPWLLAVSWAMTGLATAFFLLRLYTRIVVVKGYGVDDNIYNLAWLLLLLCTFFVHLSTQYGLGQDQFEIGKDPYQLFRCLLYLIIAQCFGVTVMAVAKVSLGLFLLRLVTVPWHRTAIWAAIIALMTVSVVTSFAFAFQCSPPNYLWDKRIEGSCPLPIAPFAIILGTSCVIADIFFAVFPWLFVWKLKKPMRERAVIAGSMSLGLFSAACGVKRTIGLGGLASDNYTRDSVPTCAWSIAELAVTMVCIGIPVCLPLWQHYVRGSTKSERSYEREENQDSEGFGMHTIGGGSMPGARSGQSSKVRNDGGESAHELFYENGHFEGKDTKDQKYAPSRATMRTDGDASSSEEGMEISPARTR